MQSDIMEEKQKRLVMDDMQVEDTDMLVANDNGLVVDDDMLVVDYYI